MPPLQSLLRKVTGSVFGSVRTGSRPSYPANRSSQYTPKKYGRSRGDTDFTQLSEAGAMEMGSTDRMDGVMADDKSSVAVPARQQDWSHGTHWDDSQAPSGIMHTIDVEVSSASIRHGHEPKSGL